MRGYGVKELGNMLTKKDKFTQPLLQLPLPFYQQENNTFENFYPASNPILIKNLKNMITTPTSSFHSLYMWGHPGVGCSHLLQASYLEAQKKGLKAIYISLDEIKKTYSPDCFQQLADYQLVCIDEIGEIARLRQWEEALFHAYNTAMGQQAIFILAAHEVPNQLAFSLPDLTSRLNSGLLFQVHELNDEEKIQALQFRASLHGLVLSEAVGQFLLSRLARNLKALFAILDKLDHSSLSHQRKLTIPFVKEVLSL